MIDQLQRVSTIVKDELKVQATKKGLDPTMVGWSVTQTFAPMPDPQTGQNVMASAWLVTVTLRLPVLSSEKPTLAFPVAVPMPPGLFVPDAAFRGCVEMSVDNLIEMRRQVDAQDQQAAQQQPLIVPGR